MTELGVSREFPTQNTINTFIGNIAGARFEKAFRDEDYYINFINFVIRRGLECKGFVVNIPIEDGTVWFKYQIRQEDKNGKRKYKYEGIDVYLADNNDYSLPDECDGYPVWWINPDEIEIR